MAQLGSSVLGDFVRSSRGIAHNDDFEGHSQYKQIFESKSYWQGYDIGI